MWQTQGGLLRLIEQSTPTRAVCIIPARGGSKRYPRKNLHYVAGLPLVARAAVTCMRARVGPVYVSTDDDEIATEAKTHGRARIIQRPRELASDESTTEASLLHAVDSLGLADDVIVVLVQCTAPLLEPSDVERCVYAVEAGADSAYCAAPFGGFIRTVPSPAPRVRTQDLPPQWHEAGSVYACRVGGLRRHGDRIHGRAEFVEVPMWRVLDIDTEPEAAWASRLIDSLAWTDADRRRHDVDHAQAMVAGRWIGGGAPCWIVGEIGVNHNGSLDRAIELAKVAKRAGFDAVKLQVRTPEACVPRGIWGEMRDTHFGERMTQLEYRRRMEFTDEQLVAFATAIDLPWFASAWDVQSCDRLKSLPGCCAIKIPSAKLTDHDLLYAARQTDLPVILSTGMSTVAEIDKAFAVLEGANPQRGREGIVLCQATSAYPCDESEINLRFMHAMRRSYAVPVGYSGHERGVQVSVAAAALGACMVERHITTDRTLPGSDHAASLEPKGMRQLVRDIRAVERAMGDGVKRVYESEMGPMRKLRGVA